MQNRNLVARYTPDSIVFVVHYLLHRTVISINHNKIAILLNCNVKKINYNSNRIHKFDYALYLKKYIFMVISQMSNHSSMW